MTIYIFIGAIVLMVGASVWHIIRIHLSRQEDRKVYRKVVERDGERVLLSCGHAVLVRRHHIDEFPCIECAEVKERIKGA